MSFKIIEQTMSNINTRCTKIPFDHTTVSPLVNKSKNTVKLIRIRSYRFFFYVTIIPGFFVFSGFHLFRVSGDGRLFLFFYFILHIFCLHKVFYVLTYFMSKDVHNETIKFTWKTLIFMESSYFSEKKNPKKPPCPRFLPSREMDGP